MNITYDSLTLKFTFEEIQTVYTSLANAMNNRVINFPKNEFDFYERRCPELSIMEAIAPFVFRSFNIDKQNLYEAWVKARANAPAV